MLIYQRGATSKVQSGFSLLLLLSISFWDVRGGTVRWSTQRHMHTARSQLKCNTDPKGGRRLFVGACAGIECRIYYIL